ncbi:MAG: hypothetical protein IT262_04245 [Saprospiraceae bacterium]|nr:hypothetical protein [Saprospiraceae bacterium]
MMKLFPKIAFPVLAYAATYTTIWLHELGHALVYRYFGCKPELFNLHVPFHFGAASPEPLNAICVATLSLFQLFLASMGGILVNIVLAAGGFWVLRRFLANTWIAWLGSVFVLANLTEAASYLTLSNIRPLGDMIAVQDYCPALRLPLGLLGIGLALCMVHFLRFVPEKWRVGLTTYCCIMAACMVGMRFVFAG